MSSIILSGLGNGGAGKLEALELVKLWLLLNIVPRPNANRP
jgi:hypothetical protein